MKQNRILNLLIMFFVSIALLVSSPAFCGKRKGGSFGSKKGFSKSFKGGGSTTKSLGGGTYHHTGMGGGYGYGYGYHRTYFFGGGGAFTWIIIVIVFVVIGGIIFIIALVMRKTRGGGKGKASVLKFQVGLLGVAKDVQERLLQLSKSGRIGTEEGEAWLLKETCLTLLRNRDSIKYVGLQKFLKLPMDQAEAKFSELAEEERAKYQIEGVRADEHGVVTDSREAKAGLTEVSQYIVVTIIVATDLNELFVDINLPPKTPVDTILKRISSVPASNLLGMEVIWQPYSPEDGVLTEDDIISSYPDLVSL